MLTPEQKRTLKLFMQFPDPANETSADDLEEVTGYKLRGRQSQARDAAVALYWHRLRMNKVIDEL
jgi:hypothetical protein